MLVVFGSFLWTVPEVSLVIICPALLVGGLLFWLGVHTGIAYASGCKPNAGAAGQPAEPTPRETWAA